MFGGNGPLGLSVLQSKDFRGQFLDFCSFVDGGRDVFFCFFVSCFRVRVRRVRDRMCYPGDTPTW